MRKKMIAAALLPLPFAAIPLLAVAFHTTSPGGEDVVFDATPTFQMAPDENAIRILPVVQQAQPLAYTGDDKSGCIEVDGGI